MILFLNSSPRSAVEVYYSLNLGVSQDMPFHTYVSFFQISNSYFAIILVSVSSSCFTLMRGILCGLYVQCMGSSFHAVYTRWSLVFRSELVDLLKRCYQSTDLIDHKIIIRIEINLQLFILFVHIHEMVLCFSMKMKESIFHDLRNWKT